RAEPKDGGEGPALAAAESLEGSERLLGEQGLDFLDLELPSPGDLGDGEIALGARAGEPLVVLLHHATALGARRAQGGVVARHGVGPVVLGALDDAARHLLDL